MIPLYKPYLTGKEKEYVIACIDSTWISSKGEFIGIFESAFANYIGANRATSVCNGTVALHLALEALGLGVGDEVIVPTFTYIASVNTIVQTGATPVFVDSDPSNWQLDIPDVRRKITPRTKAVMAVHLYGFPCDMDQLVGLCQEHQLFLIEDCAEAFGSYYKGRHVGTFGDIATFSFFGNKTITTGEGGMVVSNNARLMDRAFHLKTQGVSPDQEYWHDIAGYNYRMTNLCAAIGQAQLESADFIIEKKRTIATWYNQKLDGLSLQMLEDTTDTRQSYWLCSLLTEDRSTRDLLRAYLKTAGVETRPFFHPAHTMPMFANKERFPVAESLAQRGINLPSFPDLSQSEVAYICKLIHDFFACNINVA
ncbi:MAG: DegT/DnrJ/EryC1/StrS family aminotransferase [Pseudomonadota bacterium]